MLLIFILFSCFSIYSMTTQVKITEVTYPALYELITKNQKLLSEFSNYGHNQVYVGVLATLTTIEEKFKSDKNCPQTILLLKEIRRLLPFLKDGLTFEERETLAYKYLEIRDLTQGKTDYSKLIDISKYPALSKLEFGDKPAVKKWKKDVSREDRGLDILFVVYAIEYQFAVDLDVSKLKILLDEFDQLFKIVKRYISELACQFVCERISKLKTQL